MAPTTNPNTAHTPPRHTPPFSSSFSIFLLHFHQLPPHRPCLSLPLSFSQVTPPSLDAWLARWLAASAACQVACRRTKSSLTLQSLYIHGVPNVPSSSSFPSFRLSLSFSTHPFERYADPHIDRGANPLCRKGWRYDPDGARCK